MKTCITDERRAVHEATELAAVALVAPFAFWLARQKTLPPWARTSSLLLAVGTLAVDGSLLLTWPKRDPSK